MNLPTAEEVIAALGLEPHPLEGGFFRETYRTSQTMHGQERALKTAIYYLLTPQNCSMMHRLPGDEMFHFYLGDPVEMLQLYPDGRSALFTLGPDLAAGQHVQLLVPSGVWQGMRLIGDGGKATRIVHAGTWIDRNDELVRLHPHNFQALMPGAAELAQAPKSTRTEA